MPDQIYVLGVVVDASDSTAPEVQKILARYGSSILGRNGISDPTGSRGIITVTIQVDQEVSRRIEHELTSIGGVQARAFSLSDPLA